MSEISSGLVAVAWMDHNINTTDRGQLCFVEAQPRAVDYMAGYRCDPLVRLSDAEAIIAQKDAEIIEQCRLNGMGAERELALIAKVEKQSATLKLARSALMYDGYPCGNGCKCRACEAIAAINEVLGEVK